LPPRACIWVRGRTEEASLVRRPALRRALSVIVAGATLVLPGCLERTLTIVSHPPGARVFMNHEEIGTTPVTVPFSYGGVRELLLLHENRDEGGVNYKPVHVLQNVETFHYEVFPFDFIAEIQPFTLHDDHTLYFELEASTLVDTVEADPENYIAALMKRADQLRERARDLQESGPLAAPALYEQQEPPSSRPATEPPGS
jgi:hypothetical protein